MGVKALGVAWMADISPTERMRVLARHEWTEDSYPESFPQDFGERLERLVELAGLSWEEFAGRLGVELDRVMAWREGGIPTGGEVWHIMRLAFSVPGGIDVMLPVNSESHDEEEEKA